MKQVLESSVRLLKGLSNLLGFSAMMVQLYMLKAQLFNRLERLPTGPLFQFLWSFLLYDVVNLAALT